MNVAICVHGTSLFMHRKPEHVRKISFHSQVTVLNTTKQLLTHHIDKESTLRCKAETELKDITKKCQGSQQIIEVCSFMGCMIIGTQYYHACMHA